MFDYLKFSYFKVFFKPKIFPLGFFIFLLFSCESSLINDTANISKHEILGSLESFPLATLQKGEKFNFLRGEVVETDYDLTYLTDAYSGWFNSPSDTPTLTGWYCESDHFCNSDEDGLASFKEYVDESTFLPEESEFAYTGEVIYTSSPIEIDFTGRNTIWSKTSDNKYVAIYVTDSSSESVTFIYSYPYLLKE